MCKDTYCQQALRLHKIVLASTLCRKKYVLYTFRDTDCNSILMHEGINIVSALAFWITYSLQRPLAHSSLPPLQLSQERSR